MAKNFILTSVRLILQDADKAHCQTSLQRGQRAQGRGEGGGGGGEARKTWQPRRCPHNNGQRLSYNAAAAAATAVIAGGSRHNVCLMPKVVAWAAQPTRQHPKHLLPSSSGWNGDHKTELVACNGVPNEIRPSLTHMSRYGRTGIEDCCL